MKSSPKFILLLVLGLTAVLGIMMAAFSLPAVNSGIHNVPIGIVSNSEQMNQKVTNTLKDKGFKVTEYHDTQTMKDDINHRKIYGAIKLDSSGEVIVYKATAASTAVAQAITQVGNTIVDQQKLLGTQQIQKLLNQTTDLTTIKVLNQKLTMLNHKTVEIIELKSFPKADPNGTGLAAGALPIALGGWIGTVAIANFVKGKRQKLYALIAFAVVGGLGLVAVIQFGIGTFDGNYLLIALGAMLGIAATGFLVLGILEILGNAGLAIAAVLLILLGNPLSGLTSAPEMLPSGWGTVGQLLPPGATGTLLRNIAFFDGYAITYPIIILSSYIIFGLLLFKIGKKSILQ